MGIILKSALFVSLLVYSQRGYSEDSADSTIKSVQERLKKLKEAKPPEAETAPAKKTEASAAPASPKEKTVDAASSSESKKTKTSKRSKRLKREAAEKEAAEVAPKDKKSVVKKEEDVVEEAPEKKESAKESKPKEKLAKDKASDKSPVMDLDENKTPPPAVEPVEAAAAEEEPPAHLTGEWGGFRKKMSEKGIDLAAIYKGEVNRVFSGGLRQRTIYLENLDLKLALDGDKLFGSKGTSFLFYGLADKGADKDNVPTRNVGDLQATSNIETSVDAFKLYEAWVQQVFFDERMSVLFGR